VAAVAVALVAALPRAGVQVAPQQEQFLVDVISAAFVQEAWMLILTSLALPRDA